MHPSACIQKWCRKRSSSTPVIEVDKLGAKIVHSREEIQMYIQRDEQVQFICIISVTIEWLQPRYTHIQKLQTAESLLLCE